jgi:hypothetical protein
VQVDPIVSDEVQKNLHFNTYLEQEQTVMQRTCRRGLGWMLGAAASLLLAAPAPCQSSRTRMHSDFIDGPVHTRIDADGELRFADDDRGIAWMAPGARLIVSEERRGGTDRRVEYRGIANGFTRAFFRDGRQRQPDADDEAWIARTTLNLLRDSGINAGPRVQRIYRQGGTSAVLAEILQISSDGSQRLYYGALLGLPLSPQDRARALRQAGTSISSDGDRRYVLSRLLERPGATPLELAAMLEAAGHISSDGDRSSLLVETARYTALDDPAVRTPFFATTGGLASDGDRSRVLIAVLTRAGVRRETVVDALGSARHLASDGDRSRVLMSVQPPFLRDRAVMNAFQAALAEIASDGDKARVATWMAGSLP